VFLYGEVAQGEVETMTTRNADARRRLVEARERLGWTQEQLAVAMGRPSQAGQSLVARWETGRTKLKLEDLEAAAEAMGLPAFALLPMEDIHRTTRWVMAAARYNQELPPERAEEFASALGAITRAMGPLPDPEDDPAWNEWLAGLRRALQEAQRVAISDRARTVSPGNEPESGR